MSVIMYFKGVKNICISEYFKGSNVPEVYFKGGHYKYEETPGPTPGFSELKQATANKFRNTTKAYHTLDDSTYIVPVEWYSYCGGDNFGTGAAAWVPGSSTVSAGYATAKGWSKAYTANITTISTQLEGATSEGTVMCPDGVERPYYRRDTFKCSYIGSNYQSLTIAGKTAKSYGNSYIKYYNLEL